VVCSPRGTDPSNDPISRKVVQSGVPIVILVRLIHIRVRPHKHPLAPAPHRNRTVVALKKDLRARGGGSERGTLAPPLLLVVKPSVLYTLTLAGAPCQTTQHAPTHSARGELHTLAFPFSTHGDLHRRCLEEISPRQGRGLRQRHIGAPAAVGGQALGAVHPHTGWRALQANRACT